MSLGVIFKILFMYLFLILGATLMATELSLIIHKMNYIRFPIWGNNDLIVGTRIQGFRSKIIVEKNILACYEKKNNKKKNIKKTLIMLYNELGQS